MSEEKPITKKQQRFIDEYLKCFNGSEAARRAGYSPKACRSTASTLLTYPNISKQIRERMDEIHMSADEALSILAQQARGDIGEFMDINSMGFSLDMRAAQEKGITRLVKKIKQNVITINGKQEDKEIITTEIELHDPQTAIEKILRAYDKVKEAGSAGAPFVFAGVPAHALAPSFLASYRAVRSGLYDEFLEDGGRGSTKSHFVGFSTVELLLENPNMHALCLRQVADTLRVSSFSQVKWCIDYLGLADKFKSTTSPMEITYLPTGQKIYFSGADDPMKIKSIKPPFGYIGLVWFEEYDQFRGPEAVRIIEQSIRGGDKIYRFKTWNTPRKRDHWVNKYLQIEKASQWRHHSTYLDVPPEWLGKPWLAEAEHLKQVNPAAYEHEYLGVANGNGGQVFENVVVREIADEEIAQFDHVLHGLDWGFTVDPANYSRVHYDAARRKLYIFGELRTWKKSNRELYDELIEYGLRDADLIIADSAEPKSVADFRQFGANCRGAEKGKDSVKYSMRWLQGLTEIVIDPKRAPYHAEEFVNYEYERTKDGEIISAFPDANNHAIDSVRYATNYIWRQRGQ